MTSAGSNSVRRPWTKPAATAGSCPSSCDRTGEWSRDSAIVLAVSSEIQARMFLDKIDEDDCVDAHGAATDIIHQSHEARSRRTWLAASISRQRSLSNPRNSKMETGSAVSTASLSR